MARKPGRSKKIGAKSRRRISKGTKLPSIKTLGAFHNTIGGKV